MRWDRLPHLGRSGHSSLELSLQGESSQRGRWTLSRLKQERAAIVETWLRPGWGSREDLCLSDMELFSFFLHVSSKQKQ